MADIERVNINGTSYNIAAQETANDALMKAETANETADSALTAAKEAKSAIPTKVSELTNDAGYAKESEIPTKVSELDNDTGYITNDALDGYALEDQLPTKTSQLENDSGYVTDSALDGYAKESDVEAVKETADSALTTANEAKESIPTKVSELENDVPYATGDDLSDMGERMTNIENTAITAINVNGESVPVEHNTAEITVSGGEPTYDADSETLIF